MNKQIVAVFLTLLMIGTIFVISPNKLKVQASSGGGNGFVLDHVYIYNKTKVLSKIVETYPKGRAFGTKGEWAAADYIVGWMEDECNLGNVWKEQIKNKPSETNDDKLVVKSKGLTYYYNSNPTVVEDCYIGPRWNKTMLEPVFRKEKILTHNFSHNSLKVKRRPGFPWYDEIASYVYNKIVEGLNEDEISKNSKLNDLEFILNSVIQQFMINYSFNLDDNNLGPDNESLPWYNESIANMTDDYVLIDEDPLFNPFVELPEIIRELKNYNPLEGLPLFYNKIKILVQLWLFSFNDHCKGLILFDSNDDTYDMVNTEGMALPILFVNRNVGEDIYLDTGDFSNQWVSQHYTIDFYIDQEYDKAVTSYNVIGQINGTDQDKTVIISSLYDSWWNQGTADVVIMGTDVDDGLRSLGTVC